MVTILTSLIVNRQVISSGLILVTESIKLFDLSVCWEFKERIVIVVTFNEITRCGDRLLTLSMIDRELCIINRCGAAVIFISAHIGAE